MRTILKNGKVITPLRIIDGAGIMMINGIIEQILEDGKWEWLEGDEVIDVKGRYISPGFIDLHTHGGGGCDFMDGSLDAILTGVRIHMKHGTTTIVPTTLASSKENLFGILKCMKESRHQKGIPNILGLHLEGPYFSMEQRGAQDPTYIKNPQREDYQEILNFSDDIVRWTAAPELPGAMEFGRELSKRGIVCSMGHSNAIYEDVVRAYENGYSMITHFYSGMSMVKRINSFRHSGIVESGYLIDDLFVEVIADGMHLPESLLKLIYKIKGPDKICLVTDSMRAAGCGDGESLLGNLVTGQKVIVEDGVAKLKDRSAFAGSVATADRLVRTMVQTAGVPLVDAVKMITLTPARAMGIDHKKGSLIPGKDGDVVVFDEDIQVKLVVVGGKVMYEE